ncbi:zinc finger C3H1 domain-containing protein-like [Argonauta hians]
MSADDMIIVVKNPQYFTTKEEGELSDDDDKPNESTGAESEKNTAKENNKNLNRNPPLYNSDYRHPFSHNIRDSSCGNNNNNQNRDGEDGSSYFNQRRPPSLPTSLACGLMNPVGRCMDNNPMSSEMCGNIPGPGGGSGYWAPPPPPPPPSLRPLHPSRIPPPPHLAYRHSPPRCPVGPGLENLGSVGHCPLPPGNRDGLPCGSWQDNRRYGPMTPRSNFPLWEKKRRLRESRASLFSGSAHSFLKENTDYEELLRKYRSIQKEIANLDKEENLASQDKSSQSSAREKHGSYRTISVASKGSQESSSDSSKRSKSRWNPSKSEKRVVVVKNHKAEEEDVELEELRRIALASTLENNKPNPSASKSSQSRVARRSRSDTSRRKAYSSNRSLYKREPSVLREQSCNKSGMKWKFGFMKQRPAYRSCRRRLSSNEDKSKLVYSQRKEINKILEVDDPDEQIERLSKYLSEKKKELANNSKPPSSLSQLSESKTDSRTNKLLQDNYEEVAMEIDSDDGLAAVNDIEDIHIQREHSLTTSIPPLAPMSDKNSQDLNFDGNPKNWVSLIPPPPPPPPLPPPPPPPPLVDEPKKSGPCELPLPEANSDNIPAKSLFTFNPLSPKIQPAIFQLLPPLPPPPPLPEEPYPQSEKPPEPDYEEDEEEEKLLRAHLLQSVAIRRKENIQNPSLSIVDDTSGKDSPISPRSQSPLSCDANLADKKQPPQQLAYCAPRIPKHPSVVINLAEDSTDSEHEAEEESESQKMMPNIVQFIKDARRSVETKLKSKEVNEVKKSVRLNKQEVDMYTADRGFRELEEKYVAQRKLMLQDQRELKGLVTQASKVLTKIKSTEKKCEIFRKNLKNSDHLVAMYRKQDIKIKDKIQLVKIQLSHNESTVLQLEKNLLQIGKRLYGASYQPRTIAVDSAGNKRVLPLLSHNQLKTKIEDIPQKRQQLQQMQHQYALMLQKLQTQANKKITKSSVLQLEKISLECTEETETGSLQAAVVKKDSRRRSMISLNPNMKPEIIQNKENTLLDIHVPPDLNKTEYSFDMPESSQLSNFKTILHEKMQNLIEPGAPETVSWENFQHLTSPLNYIPYAKSDFQSLNNCQTSVHSKLFKPYKSPLLHCQAYRFSPFLRTKENLSLSCPSFSHKLNSKKILCQYDLQGSCNDQQCKSQHLKDCFMSTQEILQNILSYAPGLVGASKEQSGEKIAGHISGYVENVINQNQGRMTVDELCLLQISKVNEFVHQVPPHTMFFEPRSWKPNQENLSGAVVDIDKIYSPNSDFKPLFMSSKPDVLSEDIIEEQDVRYFDIGNDAAAILDLEAAVLENPCNEQLWLKLSYKKLSSRNRDNEYGHLDQALNVLARGLENMKHSSDLWQYYLQLYNQHPDSKKDLVEMCRVAIQNAPSYALWWQYLFATENYFNKIEICKQMQQYLKEQPPSEVVSQHITEVSLYRLGLTVVSNRFKTGLLFLKNLLQTPSSYDQELMLMLRPSNRALLWLCYIYLHEFQQLPDQLYNSTGHFLDHLFPKCLYIDWYSRSKLQCDIKFLQKLYEECLTFCLQTDGERTAEHDEVASEVYCSYLRFLHSQSRLDEASAIGHEVLLKWPYLDDVWLCLAEFYSASNNFTEVWTLFDEAMKTGCYSAKLYLYASHLSLSLNDSQGAFKYLKQASISCFLLDDKDSRCDPNLLFCCLLHQTVPHDFKVPDYSQNITPEVLERNQLYFWLNYCLLLELQKDCYQVVEAYETALSAMKSTSDIAQVWLHYLKYQIRQSAYQRNGVANRIQSQVIRCLTCLPKPVQSSTTQNWSDHHHHNKIIDLYINCLESTEEKMAAYDKFITIMPNNIKLILRAVELAVSCNDMWRALSFCQTGVHERLPCISLWNKVTALSVLRCDQVEVQQLFTKAVRVLPYAVSLWKHFLLFEVTIGAKSNVLQIIQRCQQLGLNIEGFVKTISR